MRVRLWLLAACACGSALAGACGPSPRPSPRPSPTPQPSPTPPPLPDTLSITVLATGVGTFDLATIPVAVIRNDASRHGATQVVVRFQTAAAGGSALGSLQSIAVNLEPGQEMPVAGDCTDACTGARSTSASAAAGGWTTSPGVPLWAVAAGYVCAGCGSGHQHGDVLATLVASRLAAGASVSLFAACSSAAGAIVGGGVSQTVWPGGTATSVDVPVLVNQTPAGCQVGASTGW